MGTEEADIVDWRTRIATKLVKDAVSPYGTPLKAGTTLTLLNMVKHEGKEIRFSDPSAPALFLNQSRHLLKSAHELLPIHNVQFSTKGDTSTRVFDYLEFVMGSIVFAYTALECFANEEIPNEFYYEQKQETGLYVARNKDWIERHMSLDEKLDKILPRITKIASPKGKTVWHPYGLLRKLRDRIIHMKSKDRMYSKADRMFPESIWQDLTSPNQIEYALVSKNMIAYFLKKEERYWLENCPF